MSFNFSESFFESLSELRQKLHTVEELKVRYPLLTSDEINYLRMENCVRCDEYSNWDCENTQFESEIVKDLANCYFYLYTNPQKATLLSSKILETHHLAPELINRVQFWLMDSFFLTGFKKEGVELLHKLDPLNSGPKWSAESQTIKALCLYFTNELDEAMKWHLECQKSLDKNPDYFLSIFNSSMALRIALKLCEPIYFDYFSAIIAKNATHTSEKRYTARIHTYKALLLVQMHRPQEAAEEWALADELIPHVEMKWEKGQYYLLRGFSTILCGMKEEGEYFLNKSEEFLVNAGSPPPYIADLEIAKIFNDWRSPSFLSKGLLNIQLEISRAITHLESLRRELRFSNVKEMFEDAIDYCHMIISGTPIRKKYSSSLIVSILLNSSRAEVFGSGLSDFKTYSSFVNSILSSENYSLEELKPRLEQVIGFSLFTESGKFILNDTSSKMGGLNKLLNFANHLITLNQNLEKSNEIKAMTELSKKLSHDLRSPLNRLRNISISNLDEESTAVFAESINSIENMCNEVLFGEGEIFEKRVFDLTKVLKKTIDQKKIEYPNLQIEIKINNPILVYGISSIKLERILSNLINNSFEANSTKMIITLSERHESIELGISDNGIGLSQEKIDSFNRGLKIPTSKVFGSGLGLSSSADYIRDRGGEVSLNFDDGLTIKISLPHVLHMPNELIHVEDDKYIRRDWIIKSDSKKINLLSFADFNNIKLEELNPEAYFFIDANVSHHLDGLEFSKKLNGLGFSNIFLSSGIDLNEISNYPFIKGVVDKTFPF